MSHTTLPQTTRRPGHVSVAVVTFAFVLASMGLTYATVVATTRPMGLLSTTAMVFLFAASWAVLWFLVEFVWMARPVRPADPER
jgi:hypothetical protein